MEVRQRCYKVQLPASFLRESFERRRSDGSDNNVFKCKLIADVYRFHPQPLIDKMAVCSYQTGCPEGPAQSIRKPQIYKIRYDIVSRLPCFQLGQSISSFSFLFWLFSPVSNHVPAGAPRAARSPGNLLFDPTDDSSCKSSLALL